MSPSWWQPPLVLPYDPGPARETMRGILAIVTFAGLVLAGVAVYGLFLVNRAEDARSFSELVFTAMVALAGSVGGFYFGAAGRERV